MHGPLAIKQNKGGLDLAFKLLIDKKEEEKRNNAAKKNKELKELKEKIATPDKLKTDERLSNLEKAVHFLLEKAGVKP
jgi:hypothetical protein